MPKRHDRRLDMLDGLAEPSHCHRCGRYLANPASRRVGLGTVCARKARREAGAGNGAPRAEYQHSFVNGVLCIVDTGHETTKSLTNDIEHVLAELSASLGKLMPTSVVYRDSTGRWDGIRHSGGAFGGFIAIGARTREQAVERLPRMLRGKHDDTDAKRGTEGPGRDGHHAEGAERGGGSGIRRPGAERVSGGGRRRALPEPDQAERSPKGVGSGRAGRRPRHPHED